MFSGDNKDMLMIATIMAVAAVCAFLYKENMKMKGDIVSCKDFSINLSNRIQPPAPVPTPAPVDDNEVESQVE